MVESCRATADKINQTTHIISYCSSLYQHTCGCNTGQFPDERCWEHWEDALDFCLHIVTGLQLKCMQTLWFPANAALCLHGSHSRLIMSNRGKYCRIEILSAVMPEEKKKKENKKKPRKVYCCLFHCLWKWDLSSGESNQRPFLWIFHGCFLAVDGIMLSEMAISWVSLWTASQGKFNLLNYEHISEKSCIIWYSHAESINFILLKYALMDPMRIEEVERWRSQWIRYNMQ